MKVYVNIETTWDNYDASTEEIMGVWSTPEAAEAQARPFKEAKKKAETYKHPITRTEMTKLEWDDSVRKEYIKMENEKYKYKYITQETFEFELDKPTENWK